MDEKTIRRRKYNEVIKACAGRGNVLGNTLYKAANKTYRDRSVEDFLIRGPTSLIS